MTAALRLDKVKPPAFRGNQHTGAKASWDAAAGKSADDTANLLGVSQPTVERARTVLKHADQGTEV